MEPKTLNELAEWVLKHELHLCYESPIHDHDQLNKHTISIVDCSDDAPKWGYLDVKVEDLDLGKAIEAAVALVEAELEGSQG